MLGSIYEDVQSTVTKGDFNTLLEVTTGLGEAQKRTEAGVSELAEAQRRTEARVTELAEAQKRTEARVSELAEAQKRTEDSLNRLIQRVGKLEDRLDDTNLQLGGLLATEGYTLGNTAYRTLPALLRRDHGLVVRGRLIRDYLRDADGHAREVNILGEAQDASGRRLVVLGESKAQLSSNDIDRFLRKTIQPLSVGREIFPVVVAHMTSAPEVRDHARTKGVALYLSYELDHE